MVIIHTGGWWGGWFWGGPYWGWGFPWGVAVVDGPYPPHHRYRRGDELGALDLDVAPEEAEVWVDGERLGIADNFDGFPAYLWLPGGTYDLVLYHPGYRTLARQVTVYEGRVLSIDDRMERGEAVRPEDLPATSTERRDARLRRNQERRERAERWLGEREDWRERGRDRRWEEDDDGYTVEVTPEGEIEEDEVDDEGRSVGGPAALRLEVTPGDAAVYLDGNLLGAADELARSAEGITVTPGEHRLQVVRPGYEEVDTSFTARAGRTVTLSVTLEEE